MLLKVRYGNAQIVRLLLQEGPLRVHKGRGLGRIQRPQRSTDPLSYGLVEARRVVPLIVTSSLHEPGAPFITHQAPRNAGGGIAAGSRSRLQDIKIRKIA